MTFGQSVVMQTVCLRRGTTYEDMQKKVDRAVTMNRLVGVGNYELAAACESITKEASRMYRLWVDLNGKE